MYVAVFIFYYKCLPGNSADKKTSFLRPAKTSVTKNEGSLLTLIIQLHLI